MFKTSWDQKEVLKYILYMLKGNLLNVKLKDYFLLQAHKYIYRWVLLGRMNEIWAPSIFSNFSIFTEESAELLCELFAHKLSRWWWEEQYLSIPWTPEFSDKNNILIYHQKYF